MGDTKQTQETGDTFAKQEDQLNSNDSTQAEANEANSAAATPAADTVAAPVVAPETAAPQVIQAAPAPAPVATPKPAPVAQPTKPAAAPAVTSNNFVATVAAIEANGSSFQQALLTALKTYVEEMAPGKRHLPDDAVMKQYTLWVTIRNVINSTPVEEFRNLWSLILAFFLQYGDNVFHERYVFRFTEHWRWSKQELDGFLRILNLIKLTADPKVRAVGLKQIDLNRALVLPITDDGRNRLLNFYK